MSSLHWFDIQIKDNCMYLQKHMLNTIGLIKGQRCTLHPPPPHPNKKRKEGKNKKKKKIKHNTHTKKNKYKNKNV